MIKLKNNIIHQIFVWIFCFGVLLQNGVEAPVLCFETDGHINIEAECDIACSVPTQKTDEHQDDCNNCFDIPFWNYNPDLNFLSQTSDLEMGYFVFDFTILSFEQFFNSQLSIKQIDNPLFPLPPHLKTTILLT
jgi:hypothetical protein